MSDQVSIKELASKLKVSDALLKKFIKDFAIETIREKKLVYVSNESAEILKEIIRLRDAGKKNIEIKKLFEEAQKAQKLDAKSNSAPEEETIPKPELAIASPVESQVLEVEQESVAQEIAAAVVEPQQTAEPQKEASLNISEEYYNEYLSEQVGENTLDQDVSLALHQAELGSLDEEEAETLTKDLHAFEEEPDQEEDEEERNERSEAGSNKRRRRQFSFRFIQRQIANDLKRVNYIRHKLQRGKLSTLERLHLEDSLDKRSRLLKGWTHLLRWVKN